VTFDEYLQIDALNWSSLKWMRESPAAFLYRLQNPIDDTTRLKQGRGAHAAVLEPDRFAIDYAVFPGLRRQGKEWDEFAAANSGKTILKADEWEDCLAIRDAIMSHPVAKPLLRAGKPEYVMTWTDEPTGIACKARVDWLGDCLVDLKTTYSIEKHRFGIIAARMGYHAQLAFYRTGLRFCGMGDVPVKIIAVEQAAPHDVAVFGLDDGDLYAGEQEYEELLRKVAAGRFSGQWPGRYPEEEALALPKWAFGDEDALDELGLIIAAGSAA
jgi:hypothetical protein